MRFTRSARLARIVVVAALVVGLSACEEGDLSLSGDPAQGDDGIPLMSDARAETRQTLVDLTGDLARAHELTVKSAKGRYSSCTDDSAGWEYHAEAELKLPPGQVGSLELAEQIRDQLISAGWEPSDRGGRADAGIEAADELWVVYSEKDDTISAIYVYPYRRPTLVYLSGPCLPATEKQQNAYRGAGTEPINIP